MRVHADSEANQLNRELHSYAFTTGSDIYFASGMYRPGTTEGHRLLAHELTHVVQQTGAVRLQRVNGESHLLVQRFGDVEDKHYTGTHAHNEIEKSLETKYPRLITEAPIPGGTSFGQELNLVGFADLYMSDGQIVSGVQGMYPESNKSKPLEYKNMPTPATSKRFGKWGGLHSKSPIQRGPKRNKGSWDITPDFPKEFQVGEIKPLFGLKAGLLGLGLSQLDNYVHGFQAFVKKVHADSGVTIASTSGSTLDIDLPDAIDYAKFDTEHLKAGNDALVLQGKPAKRLWVYKTNTGLYVYFEITHPYAPATYPKSIEEKVQGLDPLLKELRKKHPSIPGKLNLGKKAKPGTPPVQPPPQLVRRRVQPKPVAYIQRDAKPGAVDWDKLGKAWEQKRKTWDAGPKGAQAFLEGEGKGPTERKDVDQALKLPADNSKRKVKDETTKIKRIELWSGTTGRILGALRFKFGTVFDKISAFFDKVKAKFEKWHKKSDKIAPKGVSISWTQTAKKIILKFAVKIFKEVLVLGFNAFAACANGMMNKIVARYVEEVNEQFKDELEAVHKQVEELQTGMQDKFGIHEKQIDQFTDAVDEISQWTTILSTVEAGIRIGIQVAACVSPPGLGCLWGLVAQLAIGPALDLLTSTDYFEDNIARPAASQLMDSIAGDALRGLVAETVQAVGLGQYAAGVDSCMPRKRMDAGGSGGGSFDPNSPGVKKARDAWEKKYHDQIVKDLQEKFERGAPGTGAPAKLVTEDDLKKFIEEMKKANLSSSQMKQALERAKDKDTGKINLDTATSELQQGTAAPAASGGAGTTTVIDATAAGDSIPSGLKPATGFSIKVRTESGHTLGTKVLLAVDVFQKGEYLVTVINVPAKVTGRGWADEKTKAYLKITYTLSRTIPLAPVSPGHFLAGNNEKQLFGMLKYGIGLSPTTNKPN